MPQDNTNILSNSQMNKMLSDLKIMKLETNELRDKMRKMEDRLKNRAHLERTDEKESGAEKES